METGRSCSIDATLLFLFLSPLAGLPHFLHVIRGQDPKRTRPLSPQLRPELVLAFVHASLILSPRSRGLEANGRGFSRERGIAHPLPLVWTKQHGAGSPANLPLASSTRGELSATSRWGVRPSCCIRSVQQRAVSSVCVRTSSPMRADPTSLHVILRRVRVSRNFGGELESRVADPAAIQAFRWPRRGDAPDEHPGANHADAPAASSKDSEARLDHSTSRHTSRRAANNVSVTWTAPPSLQGCAAAALELPLDPLPTSPHIPGRTGGRQQAPGFENPWSRCPANTF